MDYGMDMDLVLIHPVRAQVASLYVEIIDLTSKLRELNQRWRWSRSFSVRKSPH